ncbi:hypothetical protein Pcinc_018144 [Petrolisthes cinctipes]|uniref:Uncharacterized protein n=1 Tax=Petrolisthes cinctipes TaxID=88211 RepID=A0AAE1FNQ6_PETCI|nr:hypothetical protein Pcinc_018144 [Petrolisthes cinctipes]
MHTHTPLPKHTPSRHALYLLVIPNFRADLFPYPYDRPATPPSSIGGEGEEEGGVEGGEEGWGEGQEMEKEIE